MFKPALIGAAILVGGVPAIASATATFGSLANFDVVNDTGHEAHGFEIELEGISRSDVLDVFGLNRNFGTPSPGDVERYGIPTVGDLTDGTGSVIGVKITYAASFANGVWSAGTPSGVFNTPGESCWAFGNVGYPNVPCDHFGVSTRGTPTKTTYTWLIDPTSSGATIAAPTAIPSVQFTPPAAPAQPVNAVIQGVAVNPAGGVQANQDNAFWVKIVQTSLPEPADLNELMGGDNPFANQAIADLNNKTETEIEWQVLQPGKVDEVSKALDLKQGDQSVVVRYQFFKYLGTFDDEGLVDPTVAETPHGDVLTAAVGNYVGEQIAGFNPQAIAPIPEPATYATLLAGLGILGLAQRRRRS